MSSRQCRSCGARVVWARTVEGKAVPLDADRNPAGNIVLLPDRGTGSRLAIYRRKGDPPIDVILARTSDADGPFTSHFATCPDRDQWRKPRVAAAKEAIS